MTYAELCRKLSRLGCRLARQGKRHEIWENPRNGRMAAIPRHSSHEVPTATLRKILSELGLDLTELTG